MAAPDIIFQNIFDSMHSLGMVYRRIFSSFFAREERKAGCGNILTRPAFAVLHSAGYGSYTPSELAVKHSMARPNMTTILKQLESCGFIGYRKNEKDKRSRSVVITDTGKNELKAMEEHMYETFRKYMEQLSPEELQRLETTSREMEFLMNKVIGSF